jgi:hypothetical protein
MKCRFSKNLLTLYPYPLLPAAFAILFFIYT